MKSENQSFKPVDATISGNEPTIVAIPLAKRTEEINKATEEAIRDFIADVIADHCLHCPHLLSRGCMEPCKKVIADLPQSMMVEYTAMWLRHKEALIRIYGASE